MTHREKVYAVCGSAPPPPVKCPICKQTVASQRWDGYGWRTTPHYSGGARTFRRGFCLGTGHYGKENR